MILVLHLMLSFISWVTCFSLSLINPISCFFFFSFLTCNNILHFELFLSVQCLNPNQCLSSVISISEAHLLVMQQRGNNILRDNLASSTVLFKISFSSLLSFQVNAQTRYKNTQGSIIWILENITFARLIPLFIKLVTSADKLMSGFMDYLDWFEWSSETNGI